VFKCLENTTYYPTTTQILRSVLEFQTCQKCSRGFIMQLKKKKHTTRVYKHKQFPLHMCRKTPTYQAFPSAPPSRFPVKPSITSSFLGLWSVRYGQVNTCTFFLFSQLRLTSPNYSLITLIRYGLDCCTFHFHNSSSVTNQQFYAVVGTWYKGF